MKVRVAVGNVKKYIDFDGNDVENFITCGNYSWIWYLVLNKWCKFRNYIIYVAVARAFGIKSEDKYSVRIYDNYEFELVNKDIFHHAISKYCDDASFFLTVEFVAVGDQPPEKITKEVRFAYFIIWICLLFKLFWHFF